MYLQICKPIVYVNIIYNYIKLKELFKNNLFMSGLR